MHYHVTKESGMNREAIESVYLSVFRKNHEADGLAILSFGATMDSRRLRKYMVALKRGMSQKCKEAFNADLDYYWLARFDQQETTKFHRDNAPKDSYLLLGYEPTKIESKLLFADYHQLIAEYGISADEYYEAYNPMFKDGAQRLRPYIREVEAFDSNAYQIVVINNSGLNSDQTLGVLHKAEIIRKDLNQPRIVNSMVLCLKPLNEPNKLPEEAEAAFVETDEISR